MIEFDATTSGNYSQDGDYSFNHTCSGNQRILIVGIVNNAALDEITAVSYNGVALTKVALGSGAIPGARDYLYYLINPDSGTHAVRIQRTNVTGPVFPNAVSYKGVKQSGQPDAKVAKSQNTTAFNTAITTVADNCWLTGVFFNAQNKAMTAAVGTVARAVSDTSHGMFDSNVAKSPAGSYSLGITGPLGMYAALVISLSPYIAPPTSSPNRTSRKNFNGYLAFVQQFFKHKMAGTTPWASPVGDLIP